MAGMNQVDMYLSDLDKLLDVYCISIFGDTLKLVLSKKNISQRKLSENLVFSESAISKWVSGTQLPYWETLDIVAEKLDFDSREESMLRQAYNWDQWLRNIREMIEELYRIIEEDGPKLSEHVLRQMYLHKIEVIGSLLAPYEIHKRVALR